MTIFEAFAKLFGSDGRRQDWTAEEWALGWAAISNDPPTVEQFNALQNISDQKANYLYRQISALSQSDTTPLSLDDNERLKRAIQLMIANAAIGVVNNLTSASATQALSANQGRILSERINKAVPAGVVLHTAASVAPDGWLLCNGAAVSRTAYADLFAAIGTAYGAGNGTTTFNVPDLRGEFIRGADGGRGVDSGRALGSAQGDAIRNITGSYFYGLDTDISSTAVANILARQSSVSAVYIGDDSPSSDAIGNFTWAQGSANKYKPLKFDASRNVPTATENRPRNIALTAMIKT